MLNTIPDMILRVAEPPCCRNSLRPFTAPAATAAGSSGDGGAAVPCAAGCKRPCSVVGCSTGSAVAELVAAVCAVGPATAVAAAAVVQYRHQDVSHAQPRVYGSSRDVQDGFLSVQMH
jgi:hypothetical protein